MTKGKCIKDKIQLHDSFNNWCVCVLVSIPLIQNSPIIKTQIITEIKIFHLPTNQ